MKKSNYIFCLFFLMLVTIVSCEKDEDLFPKATTSPLTVAELIADNDNLSAFSAAIIQVNVDSILSTSSNHTAFVPTDAALSGLDLSSMTDADLEVLLMNHLRATVNAEFVSTLTTGYTNSLATDSEGNSLSLFTNVEGETITINGVGTIQSSQQNLGGTNGVVHVVDGVLLPPTLADHIDANPNYTSFAAALSRADLTEVLDGTDRYTVFAPDNDAFEQFLVDVNGAFGWATLADIPVDVLTEVLNFHLIAGENIVSGDIDGLNSATVQGENISISGTVVADASYESGNVNLTDVQSTNGIMHGVDKVMLPEGVFQSVLSATLNMSERLEDRGFSSFLAAAALVNLSVDLDMDELTVFVPNNDGFNALFATVTNFDALSDFDTPEELETLKKLLEYHIYQGSLMTSNLTDGGTIATVHGDDITVDLSGDNPRLIPTIEGAIPSTLVVGNIGSTNGIIHEISRVLVPAELAAALGIDTGGGDGLHPVTDPELVFFDWDGKDPWWGNIGVENQASLSLDGSNYGRANFQTGGTGWQDLFWRNDPSTFNGASTVGSNLSDYALKFDINVIEPISAGTFKIRFHDNDGVDAFFDWAPWNETGEPFTTDGWITVEIPLSVLGQPDFSLVDAEFGMAFQDADVLLNFAIDNVRFDSPGNGGPDPVDDPALVFFDWNGKDPWWGNIGAENDPAISLDGESYGRANFQTGGTGWQDLFWRNDASTFFGASTVGSNVSDYVLKFDINVFEPLSAGTFKIRFHDNDGVDAFFDWAPWNESGEPFTTDGWTTVSIPCSILGVPDFSLVDAEFGMAFQDADVLLNFAIDNVRFESN